MQRRLSLLFLIIALRVFAQERVDSAAVMARILERLDALEKQNRDLIQEVRTLRRELDASRAAPQSGPVPSPAEQPSLEERVTVQEHRTAEQAQTKIEASHKFPIQLNGILLFNAFANSAYSGEFTPDEYGLLTGPNRTGATLRQTLLGLQFQGPALPGNGRINGSLMMDFWAGYSDPAANWIRLRRADISFDWKNRSFSFRQDKPLISPYQPDSLAEVGVPPLAGAGNLWLWLPQARYEERVHFGANTGLTGQLALMQTEESRAAVSAPYANSLEKARPALEGRFAFWHKFDDTRRFEIAPGFHVSTTHVAGVSVTSHIGSLDWLIAPASRFQFSGTVFKGQNVAGLGALGNGFTISSYGTVTPVHSSGGWTQLTFPVTRRLTLNLFGGFESDRVEYISGSGLVRDLTYASNIMYRLGPNVVISLEGLQTRARTFTGSSQIHNHYDLAVAYLF